jgi:hypothetical protein
LEQRESYASLEPYWDGTREARGEVLGLSSYAGPSSIFHSPAWPGTLSHGEAKEPDPNRKRGKDRKERYPRGFFDAQILPLLKRGDSYYRIATALACSISTVRRVGKIHGIDRRHLEKGAHAKWGIEAC